MYLIDICYSFLIKKCFIMIGHVSATILMKMYRRSDFAPFRSTRWLSFVSCYSDRQVSPLNTDAVFVAGNETRVVNIIKNVIL